MTPRTFDWCMPPFAHQREEFENHCEDEARGFWWEPGCAKTAVAIVEACHLFDLGKVDCLLVVAPNGIHTNWLTDEWPKHAPQRIRDVAQVVEWSSAAARKEPWRQDVRAAVGNAKFLFLAMTYHSVMVEKGEALLRLALEKRRCFLVLDESARIKSPASKWTRRIRAVSHRAPYRRALTGTPVAHGPFDVFAQVAFLTPTAWASMGCSTFAAFKATFGEWGKGYGAGGRSFPKLNAYRNLDKLRHVLDSVGRRVTKDEVLDLPPQLYAKRYFELSNKQQGAYASLRETLRADVGGGEVTAALAIVALTRLQQICCGFIVDDDGNHRPFPENPRAECYREAVGDVAGQFITFGKYRWDIDECARVLKEEGVTFARYDGTTSDEDRLKARQGFQAGDVQCFLGNPAAAGEGLTLTAAKTVLYYSVGFKLSDRLQSEARAHRAGQTSNVLYIDVVAADFSYFSPEENAVVLAHTVDARIVQALRDKRDVAALVTGDTLASWI